MMHALLSLLSFKIHAAVQLNQETLARTGGGVGQDLVLSEGPEVEGLLADLELAPGRADADACLEDLAGMHAVDADPDKVAHGREWKREGRGRGARLTGIMIHREGECTRRFEPGVKACVKRARSARSLGSEY